MNIIENFLDETIANLISQRMYESDKWMDNFGGQDNLEFLNFKNAPYEEKDGFGIDIPQAIINKVKELDYIRSYDIVESFWSLYEVGSYLNSHTDMSETGDRSIAFVYNLTPEWNPVWGGLFNLQDGNKFTAVSPIFNSLVLFKVPNNHFVSEISQRAERSRLSFSGWLKEI